MMASAKESNHRRRLRLATRLCGLAVAVVVALPVLPWTWSPLVLPALSPYVAVGSAIAARSGGNCVRACPAGILHADAHGVAAFLAPVVRFDEDYCRKDCRRCLEVCPSGAIRRLSLEAKQHAPIGLARVELELCLLYYDKECNLCARECPYEAVTFAWNEEEYIRSPRVDPARCPGCGACQVVCPGTNDSQREHAAVPVPLRKAIRVDADLGFC